MKKQHWQDWCNALLGVWVLISPWAFEHAMEIPVGPSAVTGGGMWNLYAVGAIVAAVSVLALLSYSAWKQWLNLALGSWLVISPWILRVTTSDALTWNAVTAGLLILSLASSVLYEERAGPV